MKIYLVEDRFTGTFGDGEVSVDSAWLDENIARAVAASRYAHSVTDIEVHEGEDVPEYAREAYEHLMAWKKKNPKKDYFNWEYDYKYRGYKK